jgi:protein-tyrosine phosphatase
MSMTLRLRILHLFLLSSLGVVLAMQQITIARTIGINSPTCELLSPGRFRIDFHPSPDAEPVKVFASSRPDRIESDKPVLTILKPPQEIFLPDQTARVYFHLKPASGPTRVVSVRRLPLEGARNFRDLGGYRTSDGRYVRWGLVYRSNDLANLTPKDSKYLNQLGIKLVCDVRANAERTRAPDHWEGSTPEFFQVPIGPNRDGTLSTEDLKRRVDAAKSKGPIHGYDYAITDAQQYGRILKRISAGDVPMVEHCSSGKDRTGVFSAILLTALGVPRDTVLADYMLTSEYLLDADTIGRTTADLQRIFGLAEPPDAETVKVIMTTRRETLEATFDNINKTYGSFDNYLRTGLNLSDPELRALRERLLEF